MDNSTRNPYLKGGGTAIDTSCEIALFARNLAEIAVALGRPEAAEPFRRDAEELARRINEKMWDGERRFYFDLTLEEKRVPVKTIAGFWALVARVATAERAEALVAELNNPRTFKTLHRVPTLAADQEGFSAETGRYWRGAVWAPTTMMVIRGLEKYGHDDLARVIALNHLDNAVAVFKATGTIWENYAPQKVAPGRPAKRDFVGWSGIAPIALFIEYAIGIKADAATGTIVWRIRSPERVGVGKFWFGGRTVSLICEEADGEGERLLKVESDRACKLIVKLNGGSREISVPAGKAVEVRLSAREPGETAQETAGAGRARVIVPVGPKNPRNSEAAILRRKDGSLLLGWTEFYAGSSEDHGPARLSGRISTDGGKTWGEKQTLVENDGQCNVMEVNFLRLRNGNIALFYCQKNTRSTDCRVMMRVSKDEGRSWGPAKQLSPAGKYTGLTNGRALRLKSGRILLETWEGGDSYCTLSDDDGNTWRESQRVKPAGSPCYEPACIELKDGRVLMLMRTLLGGQYRSISEDGGETWSPPERTPLVGTDAPVSLSRVPTTGDLLAIWNHNPGANARNPLTAAISRDEGKTWGSFRNLEDAPGDAWAYPAVTWIENRAHITYFNYRGGHSLFLRVLPARWFYERAPSE
jgi:predicted neuraminidase